VPLVTNLLNGGFGYAQLRLCTPVAFDHWLRPPFRSRGNSPAGRRGQLPATISNDWLTTATRSHWQSQFAPDDISITAEQNVVTIEGSKPEKAEREFLYRGISTRHFKRQFSLADYVKVKRAAFDNGLLKIELVREIPEAMKPRRIAINGVTADNVQK
jgi:Hsp20/alpha crystallin family